MSMYGSNTKFALAFQNSWDTAASTSSLYLFPFISETVAPQRPELISANNFGRFDEGEAYRGPENVEGTISAEPTARSMGIMMTSLMGEAVATRVHSFVYEHVFKPNLADFDVNATGIPMSLYKLADDGGQAFYHKNLVCTGLNITLNNGELMMFESTLTGGTPNKVNSIGLTDDVSEKFTWDVTSLQLNGAAASVFSELQISVNENASARWTLKQSRTPDRVKRDDKRQVRITGTAKYENQDEYDKFISNSAQNLVLHLQGVLEVQSGYYPSIKIEVPSFKYLTYPVNVDGAGEMEVQFEGKADYSSGSGCSIAFTLQNTLSSYR